MMKKLALAAFACFVVTTIVTVGAWADDIQITLSQSLGNSIQFKDTGSAAYAATFVNSCVYANCIAGNSLLDLGSSTIDGKYKMWIVGGPLSLTGSSGWYTVNQGNTDVYLQVWLGPNGDGSQGKFLADVTLSDMYGGWVVPGQVTTVTIDGSFVPTTSTLSFATFYPVGVSGSMSITIDLPKNSSLAPLKKNSMLSGKLSSGELDAPVPEPSSLALLGTSVLGLAALIRRKMN